MFSKLALGAKEKENAKEKCKGGGGGTPQARPVCTTAQSIALAGTEATGSLPAKERPGATNRGRTFQAVSK